MKNEYVILRQRGDMCLFTSALRASVNKSHIPSMPQNNLYLSVECRDNLTLYSILLRVYILHNKSFSLRYYRSEDRNCMASTSSLILAEILIRGVYLHGYLTNVYGFMNYFLPPQIKDKTCN